MGFTSITVYLPGPNCPAEFCRNPLSMSPIGLDENDPGRGEITVGSVHARSQANPTCVTYSLVRRGPPQINPPNWRRPKIGFSLSTRRRLSLPASFPELPNSGSLPGAIRSRGQRCSGQASLPAVEPWLPARRKKTSVRVRPAELLDAGPRAQRGFRAARMPALHVRHGGLTPHWPPLPVAPGSPRQGRGISS